MRRPARPVLRHDQRRGANGAIVHYRVSEETNRKLEPGSVYLVDSGGQYPDGTTDITRTVWVGPGAPDAEVKDRFTRVLKGHIALARAVFPAGTAGSQLDTLARQHLWRRAWIMPMAPGMAWAAFLPCMKAPAHRQIGGPGRHGSGAAARHVPVQ
jgi:Xaa-Pro aminopeptidase